MIISDFRGRSETLQQELVDKQQELKAYEDKVDRLEKRQAEFADYQEEKILENAVEQLKNVNRLWRTSTNFSLRLRVSLKN